MIVILNTNRQDSQELKVSRVTAPEFNTIGLFDRYGTMT
jgi:hypothetical protein